MTVIGTLTPPMNMRVIPIFFPSIPSTINRLPLLVTSGDSPRPTLRVGSPTTPPSEVRKSGTVPSCLSSLFEFYFHVNARRKVQPHQGVHRMLRRLHYVHEPFVCAYFELLPALLVNVRGPQHAELVYLGGQRDRAFDARPRPLGCLDYLLDGAVEKPVVVSLESYPYPLAFHFSVSCTSITAAIGNGFPYAIILVTTPAPTVFPPSLTANLTPSSMAIGVISSTSSVTLSPGITISVPPGSVATPVTSVVLK